jgi:LmbE family N-acetylglucosaminyl deacetylase
MGFVGGFGVGGAEVRVVLTPRMDAEVIGVGGTIALLSRAGCDGVVVYLSDGAGAFEGRVPEGGPGIPVSAGGGERVLGILGVSSPPVFSTSRILGLTSLSRGPWIGWWS